MENSYEIWKAIEGYEGLYEVSNHGRIKSLKRISGKYSHLNTKYLSLQGKDYLRVKLRKDMSDKSFLVHRLVALAFVSNDNPSVNSMVNHKDENKKNNNADNLEWCDAKYNATYGTAIDRRRDVITGEKHFRYGKQLSEDHKLKLSQSNKNHLMTGGGTTSKRIKCDDLIFLSIKECAEYYGVSRTSMVRWLNGTRKMPSDFIKMGLMVEVPKLTTKEISMEELMEYKSERGAGALGSSGK